LFIVLVAACPAPLAPDPPPLPDAGDEAFVRRLVPVMLGRGPLALQEVEVFLQILEQTDRETLVHALARSEEYRLRWGGVLLDALAVNRIGERANAPCFGVPLLTDDEGELAGWLRDHSPTEEPYAAAWTMADLVRSSLVLDDISPLWRAHLFAQLAKDIPLQGVEAAAILRKSLWELFEQTYLSRQQTCLPCHNSDWSMTDHPDPDLDRSWPLPGQPERALFGSATGTPQEPLYNLFRKHGVLGGYNVYDQQYDLPETGCEGDAGAGCDGCACEEYVCEQEPACCTDEWLPICQQLCIEADVGCLPGLPENFDGCTELFSYPGCGGCSCEEFVCASNPGCCEDSWSVPCAEQCRLHFPDSCSRPGGIYDFWDFGEDAIGVWGMDSACGLFDPPGLGGEDPLGLDTLFIESLGTSASVWDLERLLRDGVDELRGRATIDAVDVEGPAAFAYLVSIRIADVVWTDIYGSALTTPHNLPRNQAQRDTLESLTFAFIDGGYSLSDLISAAVTHPTFNPIAPVDVDTAEPGATPYALPPLFDPWLRGWNNPGDVLHRRNPRDLAYAATAALGLPDWPAFPADPGWGSEGRLQEHLGFYLKDSLPGFEGNDYMGLVAWEVAFGTCEGEMEAQDGCTPRAANGCDGCACEYAVCVAVPSCCSGRWDAKCADLCMESAAGCAAPEGAPAPARPWLDGLLDDLEVFDMEHSEAPASLEEAVVAVKDRILADPTLEDGEERVLLEDLLGTTLDTPASQTEDLEQALRWACSAFLASPSFQFAGLATTPARGSSGRLVPTGSSFEDFCAAAADWFEPGRMTCTDSAVTLAPTER